MPSAQRSRCAGILSPSAFILSFELIPALDWGTDTSCRARARLKKPDQDGWQSDYVGTPRSARSDVCQGSWQEANVLLVRYVPVPVAPTLCSNARGYADAELMLPVDKSYWSAGPRDEAGYASQQTLYEDLGVDLLDHSFEGFNTCIFACELP